MKLAFVGLMHSGKSTAAQYFVDYHGFTRIALADPVKAIAVNTLNDVLSYLPDKYGVQIDRGELNEIKNNPHVRHLLQFIGTELGREWTGNNEIWINELLRIIRTEEYYMETQHNAAFDVVNDDCRFINEAKALQDNGFTLVRVQRDENERLSSLYKAVEKQNKNKTDDDIIDIMRNMMQHPSETEMSSIDADVTIYNDEHFFETLKQLL